MRAVRNGNFNMMNWLLDLGADVNSTAGTCPPLHVAMETRKLEIVDWLISKGAKIDAKDKDGQTALHCAVRYVPSPPLPHPHPLPFLFPSFSPSPSPSSKEQKRKNSTPSLAEPRKLLAG